MAAGPGQGPSVAILTGDLIGLAAPDRAWFIAPTARMQIDGNIRLPESVTSEYYTSSGEYHRPDMINGPSMRRTRLEIAGGFLERFAFVLGADFSSLALPAMADVYVNARIHPLLNVQVGQFDAPFTMENRTLDRNLDFHERSLAVRAVGIPTNKEIGLMLWGEMPNRFLYYSVGAFTGDGPNRLNRDNYMDVMGRAFAHPLITLGGLLQNLQIGASMRLGWRGKSVDYPYPTMTTQGGWTFFDSALMASGMPITIVPDGFQFGFGAEMDVPIGRFDFRAEYINVRNGTSEMAAAASDPLLLAGSAQRLGYQTAFGYYGQVGYWLLGDPAINGRAGYQNPPSIPIVRTVANQPPYALQAVARFDGVTTWYQGSVRGNPRGSGPADGSYEVWAAEFGVNFWWTRHARLSLNYVQYFFPNRSTGSGDPGFFQNHAHGPNGAASAFGELSARLWLSL